MKERGIPYSPEMIRARRAGLKTQTRRVMQVQPLEVTLVESGNHIFDFRTDKTNLSGLITLDQLLKQCPFGQPGDHLWTREACRFPKDLDHLSPAEIAEKCLDAGYRTAWAPIQFEADGERAKWDQSWWPVRDIEPGRYRHGRFMPRWASRGLDSVVTVRLERLQDISEADAMAEGCQPAHWEVEDGAAADLIDWPLKERGQPYRNGFALLWERINGAGSWGANPWLWAVTFKPITL